MNPTTVVLFVMVSSALLGGIAGAGKNAAMLGAFLGLIFGPPGLIATLGIDSRPQSQQCGQHVNPGFRLCPFCHTTFTSADQPATTAQTAADVKAELRELCCHRHTQSIAQWVLFFTRSVCALPNQRGRSP
jgi:hypothetical protein